MVTVALVSLLEIWLSLLSTACGCYCSHYSWCCGLLLNWLLVLLLMHLLLFVGIFIVVVTVLLGSLLVLTIVVIAFVVNIVVACVLDTSANPDLCHLIVIVFVGVDIFFWFVIVVSLLLLRWLYLLLVSLLLLFPLFTGVDAAADAFAIVVCIAAIVDILVFVLNKSFSELLLKVLPYCCCF
jgi:hypothetical protein